MRKPILVIGHRNPDTDSICSAIGYAHLKTALGEYALPARAGKINTETRFVLEICQYAAPMLVTDLYPRVRDIMTTEFITVSSRDTLRHLGWIMKQHDVKSIMVVDEKSSLLGIVSLGDLAKRYFDELEMQDLRQADVDFEGVLKVLDGALITGDNLQRKIVGKLRIAAGSTETINMVVGQGDVVLVGDRDNAQRACLARGIDCLIVTGGVDPSEEIRTIALEQGVVVIKAPYDTYTCARLINQSIPTSMIMQEKTVCFKPGDLVSDVKKMIRSTNFRNYPVVENGKLVGIINREHLFVRERDQVILVDHNEQSQAVEGIEEAQIIEIIDHHRLGGLTTSEPIFIRHEPVGCTATIVANMYWHRGITIPSSIAGLLLAAIISDTALFKSPTSTLKDRETADRLAKIAAVEVMDFGMQMLRAGASIKGKDAAEVVRSDMKEFQIAQYRTAVAQLSVMDVSEIFAIRRQIQTEIEVMCVRENYDLVLLMVTDIVREGTYLFYAGEHIEMVFQAFPGKHEEGMVYLPGVMSRKKQVIPPLVEIARL